MTASDRTRERAASIAALCLFLGEAGGPHRGDRRVSGAAERARELLTGAARPGLPDDALRDLDEALGALDEALRAAGDPRGLRGRGRGPGGPVPGPGLPGLGRTVKVAVCPGELLPCGRRERAKDLWPAPVCAAHGGRMAKERLGREP
ncbi:hypothetical protein [Streptomyces sp. NPDC001985]|uniref:hypothetical protein n=1 Tax=Streptomyces sp. NPDC001985 TaxID=3154406 RepID=UPI00332730EF